MKTLSILLLLAICTTTGYAANYDYIDPGDYYYVNNFGDDNPYVVVVVVRKLERGGDIKVRVHHLHF